MIWIIIILGLAADFFSKQWVLDNLTTGKVVEIIPGYLDFSYLENRGAAFGIFQGQVQLLSVVAVGISLVILAYLIRNRDLHPLAKISLSLIVAGALGNVYDRVSYGFVVDFIHFHLNNRWHFPTFNVADMCVVIGAGLMILYVLFLDKDESGARA